MMSGPDRLAPTARTGDAGRYEHAARLLLDARAGDEQAIAELVRTLTPLLWNVARGEGLDRDLAEDAVQEVWLSLLRENHDIRSPRALTGWLITVTRRVAMRIGDKQGRQRLVDPSTMPELPSDRPSAEEWLVETDRDARLWENVRRLPARCRRLLRIVAFVERPDYDTVSEELDMPRGSIGPTRGRCLNQLRLLLASDPSWSSS